MSDGGKMDGDFLAALATCLLIGVATGYIAKKKDRSPWKWGALGLFVFGPVVHTVVGVLIAFFFFS
jgi:uncharacterized membrane protein